MPTKKSELFLELKAIWKDDDMFELAISAANDAFSGKTEVYDQSETLLEFAKNLKGFPIETNSLFYEAGQKDSYVYFSMRFYVLGRAGLAGVEIHLESNVSTEFRPEEKSKLKLEIIVEQNAIDSFQLALLNVARYEEGTATLYGIK